MSTQADIGQGTLFKRNGTTIAEVTNVTGPAYSRDVIDATHNESPDGFREKIGGLTDAGDVTFDLQFIPGNSGHQAMRDDTFSTASVGYSLTFPNGEVCAFNGWCSAFEATAPTDDKMTASVTVSITGKPSWS